MARSQQALSTGPTLADQAYRALREEIISGVLGPGERLTERHLAARLGVSPTPVREALQRLEHEHLIQRTGTRRLLVAEPSVHRLYELTLIEAALRGVGARLAAENASERELLAIEQAQAAFTESLTAERVLAAARSRSECAQGFPPRCRLQPARTAPSRFRRPPLPPTPGHRGHSPRADPICGFCVPTSRFP